MLIDRIVASHLTGFYDSFDTWQDAVRGSGEALKKQGFIDDRYIEAVIACVEEYGPYIVIAPDIAMPHSTENAAGVYQTGIGFMKVNQPVSFEEGNPEKDARLFFMLAAVDHEQHLQNMMDLSEMLMNEELVNDLKQVNSDEDLLAVAKKYQNS